MEGIIGIIIVYFVFNMLFKSLKGITKPSDSAQTEATKPQPAEPPKPKTKQNDLRFPTVTASKPSTPVYSASTMPFHTEGVVNHTPLGETYTPMAPSSDLKNQFSSYQGSMKPRGTEGIGYMAEKFEPMAPIDNKPESSLTILPAKFNRDSLVQAVVMSEILQRPEAAQ